VFKEFKEFAMRGNVLDMAVGIVIGAAFGRIVTSFVEDMLMPPIGLLLGKVDFSNLFLSLTGQSFDSLERVREIAEQLPSLRKVVVVPNLEERPDVSDIPKAVTLDEWLRLFAVWQSQRDGR